jgi:type II secretory pathway pseudopilin PulG
MREIGGRDEEGFTIIEVLIAAFILVLGSLAVFMTFGAAIHNIQRSRETQVGLSVAQREMEKIRAVPYSEIGLETPAPSSTEVGNPGTRVRNSSEYNLTRSPTGTASWQSIVNGGKVKPGPEELASIGGTKVVVYRYITSQEDAALKASDYCKEDPAKAACTANQRKRVVIDVWPIQQPNATSRHSYYELQSDFINPKP